MPKLLTSDEPSALTLVNEAGASPIVLICEHAGRVIPQRLGTLGLSEQERSAHNAWDIGAEAVTRMMSAALDAPAAIQHYSRLVYDCNRPPESPGAMLAEGEFAPVPGNQNLSVTDKLARINEIYRPFHDGVSRLLDARAANGKQTFMVTIHSFTRTFRGKARDVELGILHHQDTTLAEILLRGEAAFTGFDTRRNEPYGPEDGVAHTLDLHGNARGLPNVMIEIRNDLISDEAGQQAWADRLVKAMQRATKRIEQV